MRLRITLLLLLTGFVSLQLLAQQEEPQDQTFTVSEPVNLDFNQEEEPIVTKKKKVKKKVFYGIKTKKGFSRKGTGDRVTYELFYYLKKSEMPKTFVRDIYYYDYTRKEIRKTSKFDPTKGVLLHGPYKKVMNEVVLEEGIYYKGTKHGRWMSYKRDSTLSDKSKYFRGWPKESQVSYYDPTVRKKVKEIIPIEFGEKEGFYYMFHENGLVAVTGEFQWDKRIGNWVEYYPTGKRKKLVVYPKEAFGKEVIPYVKTEWNEKGKEVYRNNKMSVK